MAAVLVPTASSTRRYVCRSGDPKPSGDTIPAGSILQELDTDAVFSFDGSNWVKRPHTDHALQGEIISLLQDQNQMLANLYELLAAHF